MSIWKAATDLLGRRQCKRCHKFFLPRKEGQEYGPKCARYMTVEVVGELELLPNLEEVQV